MRPTPDEARLALAAKGSAEQRLAALSLCPPWRHAAFAATMAAVVAAPALPLAWRGVVLGLVFVSIALIVRSDRRRLGVFINGYRRGRTRLVVFPLLLVILALYAAGIWFGSKGQTGVTLALAGVAFVVAYAGSILWQRVFVDELRG